ncbi:hypothetical protein QSI_1508 [Clostridioides difficile P28]|nr:hypothetical protein QSI_1508 [Clostridioides difficile P28]
MIKNYNKGTRIGNISGDGLHKIILYYMISSCCCMKWYVSSYGYQSNFYK